MRFAFADPPYLGCCKLYDHVHSAGTGASWDDARCWDDLGKHRDLIRWLGDGEYDGWAYCMTSQSLRHILPATDDVSYRIASWVKPFAAYKRNVRIAYTWEPVLFSPGRDSSRDGAPVGRDHLAEPIQLMAGQTGAKPQRFNRWALDLLGFIDGEDELHDLFPGSAGMERTLDAPPLRFEETA